MKSMIKGLILFMVLDLGLAGVLIYFFGFSRVSSLAEEYSYILFILILVYLGYKHVRKRRHIEVEQ